MGSRLLMMAVSLAIANYGYQAIGPHDWATALDRSFFQGAALFYVWAALRFDRNVTVVVGGSEHRGSHDVFKSTSD